MLWLMESPYTILLAGAFLVGLCIFAWFQNGRKELLWGVLGILALTLAFFGLERWWVTESEAIKITIHQIARDIESNDVERMLPHIHSAAPEISERARNEVRKYNFKSISVKDNFEIKHSPEHQPPMAIVKFNAVAVLDVAQLSKEMTIARIIEFKMYKDSADGKWKIADYGHRSPIPGQASQYDQALQGDR